jgi:hypothetical protein
VAIAQQLQAESTAQNNTGQTVSVTLGAGSNRYMVVALVADVASLAPPSSVTYGGNALALITDGAITASTISTAGGVFMYRLLEANMPADGANDLIVSWGATTNYIMGWWILTGVQQGNAADVKSTAETTTATTVTATLDAGATTDAVICAVYKNDTTGSVAVTISGAGVTEDFDVSLATGGARGAAGTDLPAVASGTIACVATVSSTNRRIITAIRLAEAAAVANLDGALSFPAEIAGTLSSPRNVDGALSFPVSIDVDANFLIEAGDGALSFPAQVAGSLSVPANLSGALSFGWGLDGENALDVEGTVLFGALSFPAQVAGALSVPANAEGALSFPVSIDVDADFIIEADAALDFGWEIAGSLAHVASVDGALSFPVQVSGRVRTQFHGSCMLLDGPAATAELEHVDAGFANLLNGPSGTASLEAS